MVTLPIFFVASCFPAPGTNLTPRDAPLYDNVGFTPGSRPNERPEPKAKSAVKVVPDYYYRKPDPSGAVVVEPRPVRYPPSSRFYSNPYALKPPRNFPYYDSDHYYIPPKGSDRSNEDAEVGPQAPSSQRFENNRQLY